MEKDLGKAVMDKELREELGVSTEEQEQEEGYTLVKHKTRRIRKLEEELGSVLVDHKGRKTIHYKFANIGAGIGEA